MDFLSIDGTFFHAWGYPVNYLEFFGLLSGIIYVVLSALGNIWNWPIGIINVIISFFIFYHVQLYPDMFLQVFFFATNMIGWWRWAHPKQNEQDCKKELKVSFMKPRQLLIIAISVIPVTFLFGLFSQNLHQLMPSVFPKPGASPYLDSFITVMSIVTTFYMIEKKIECWIFWIIIDVIATYLYFTRGIPLYSLLYFIFTVIACFALWNWIREYRTYSVSG